MSEKSHPKVGAVLEDLNLLDGKVDTLLALTRQILRVKGDYMIIIEEYAQLLAQIEPQLQMAVSGRELRAKLKQLQEAHSEVMAKVQSDQDIIRGQISSLKKKGKVVITYTDQLPKRISLGTRRKV